MKKWSNFPGHLLFILLPLICTMAIWPQTENVDFNSERWEILDPQAQQMNYLGRESLYLAQGIAILKDAQFENGTIEVDIATPGFRGFAGIIFRYQSRKEYELFYLRPHKSRLADALQYTPLLNGLSAWQLYSGEGFTAAAEIPTNRWVHLKMVIHGDQAEVYLDGATEPSLQVEDLKGRAAGGAIGLWGFRGAVHFANFRYTAATRGVADVPQTPVKVAPGIIQRWLLSPSFVWGEALPEALPTAAEMRDLAWMPIESESSGIVNVSRFRKRATDDLPEVQENDRDAVYARVIIDSDRQQVKKLSFGYSDEVSIFLNGQVLFAGNSTFRSRDPGFLGIVGLGNDAVYLPLKKGRNELVLTLLETFGGWGYICSIADRHGIKLRVK